MENLHIFLKAWCPKEESLPFFPRTVQMKGTEGFPGVERKKPHHDVFCTTARSWPLPDTQWCLNFLLLFVSYYYFTFCYCSPALFPLQRTLLCPAADNSRDQYSHIQRPVTPHTHKHRYINWLYMPFAYFILWNVMDATNSCHKIDPFCCCTCPSFIWSLLP